MESHLLNFDFADICSLFFQKKSVIRSGVVTIIDTMKIGSGEVRKEDFRICARQAVFTPINLVIVQ